MVGSDRLGEGTCHKLFLESPTVVDFDSRPFAETGSLIFHHPIPHVLRDLGPLEAQGKVEGFFTNAENAAKLDDLVEDSRDAVLGYQVCRSGGLFAPRLMFALDLTATRCLRQATTRYLRQATRYLQ